MPCPLRFVLAGVSAAVLATLFFMGRSDPALEKQKVSGSSALGHAGTSQTGSAALPVLPAEAKLCAAATVAWCSGGQIRVHAAICHRSPLPLVPQAASEDSAGSRARQWLRLLLDFFTGKYLYDTWRKSGSSSHASSGAANKASGCPFARLHGGGTGAADAQTAAAAAGCPAHKHAAAAAAAGSDRQGLHKE